MANITLANIIAGDSDHSTIVIYQGKDQIPVSDKFGKCESSFTGNGQARMKESEALNLLENYSRNEPWKKHCEAVSLLSVHVGVFFSKTIEIDMEFLKSAALLHDIGRYQTHDPIQHGIEGYRLLMQLGFPREAHFCASHILFGLSPLEAGQYGLPRKPYIPQTFEEKVVALIDFLIEFDRPTTLDSRFASLRERNGHNEYFLSRLDEAEMKANEFLKEINDQFGVSLENLICTAPTLKSY